MPQVRTVAMCLGIGCGVSAAGGCTTTELAATSKTFRAIADGAEAYNRIRPRKDENAEYIAAFSGILAELLNPNPQ